MKQDSWIKYNHISHLKKSINRIFLLRHGRSLANKANIIVSNPKDESKNYGLLTQGKNEIKKAIKSARIILELKEFIIYSSPFLRAKESSLFLSDILKAKSINVKSIDYDDRLRERYFGEYDLSICENYEKIWAEDFRDPSHKKWRVESTYEVLDRSTSLIIDIEKEHSGKNIFLVTHGDICQILISAFLGRGPKYHRQIDLLKTGELRELKIED